MVKQVSSDKLTIKSICDELFSARSRSNYAKFMIKDSKFIKILYNRDNSVDIATNIYDSNISYEISNIYRSGNTSPSRLSEFIMRVYNKYN